MNIVSIKWILVFTLLQHNIKSFDLIKLILILLFLNYLNNRFLDVLLYALILQFLEHLSILDMNLWSIVSIDFFYGKNTQTLAFELIFNLFLGFYILMIVSLWRVLVSFRLSVRITLLYDTVFKVSHTTTVSDEVEIDALVKDQSVICCRLLILNLQWKLLSEIWRVLEHTISLALTHNSGLQVFAGWVASLWSLSSFDRFCWWTANRDLGQTVVVLIALLVDST